VTNVRAAPRPRLAGQAMPAALPLASAPGRGRPPAQPPPRSTITARSASRSTKPHP